MSHGPLKGLRVLELAGIGPAPFAAMMLADMGADVIRVDRTKPGSGLMAFDPKKELMNRGRRSIAVDTKSPEGAALVLDLVEKCDVLLEGFRPGVTERLGLGPDDCLKRNPRLVYARMTGWGQQGPLAHAAGHDINYIALAGALHGIGRAGEPPVPPLNLVGDFGGGGMMMAFGILCGVFEAQRSGKGQVIDAAMVDGASTLMTFFHGFAAMGLHREERGTNLLDTGAPFYDVFETSDGHYISIGPIEAHFYQDFIQRIGMQDDELLSQQLNLPAWPQMKARLAELFRTKTRQQWCELLEGTDVCFAPVLSMSEAKEHPHMKARDAFVEIEGISQPAPAPRFSRTPGKIQSGPPRQGEHTLATLRELGISQERLDALLEAKVVKQA